MDKAQDTPLDILTKSIVFGEELLRDLAKEENLEVEHKIVLALYRKLLEQIDGNFILADAQSEGPSYVMIRAALETYLSIKYVLQEQRRFKIEPIAITLDL